MRGEPPNCYKVPDLGFAMHSEFTRRGIVCEAAQLLLDYAEREKSVKNVIGLCDPANAASKRVFQKLSFEDRGVKTLRVFGDMKGQVFVKPGMDEDLGLYGF